MEQYSISFTLGKASDPHGANIEHNNRKFLAKNVNENRTHFNVTYHQESIESAYEKLFGNAVAEYNAKQNRPCRRINDYLEHISNGSREEAFYEIVVQFGDSKTAPCGSQNGEAAKKMLQNYMEDFQKRNPNLYVFNAVLHMDEASPHLHIDFIPFYTQNRKRGLSKGVSMRAALMEQGFAPKNSGENQLTLWQDSEREILEKILQKNGFSRNDKNAKYAHLSVDEYKAMQDSKKLAEIIRADKKVSSDEANLQRISSLKEELNYAKRLAKKLHVQQQSPYKSFYYSQEDKMNFVLDQMRQMKIPFRETENGFEAQECYVRTIREIENKYISPAMSLRDTVRNDIDRYLMQSGAFDELLKKLAAHGYEVKYGKYIAVKPPKGERFLRLKSLGGEYSEFALRNRIRSKKNFEASVAEKISSAADKSAYGYTVLRTVDFYMVTFSKNVLPIRKKNKSKPFSWQNDAELDRLLELNRLINEGASLDSIRAGFEQAEEEYQKSAKELESEKSCLRVHKNLENAINVYFRNMRSDTMSREQAEHILQEYPAINIENFNRIDLLLKKDSEDILIAEEKHKAATHKLKESADLLDLAEKVQGGTFVQTLVHEEKLRRQADVMVNGHYYADRRKIK